MIYYWKYHISPHVSSGQYQIWLSERVHGLIDHVGADWILPE
jgi:hypothetical protein